MRRIAEGLLALSIAAVFSAPSAAAPAKPVLPDAVQLLDRAYAGPVQPYQGRVVLSQWSERENSSEEVNVFYLPPNRYRLEFLTPDGAVDRIVLGDGTREQVQLIKQGKTFAGYSNDISPRVIDRAEERRLLLSNYEVTVLGSEDVMGRPAWVLDLTPHADGKPSQRMWIDRETNAVLEVKRALASENAGATSRFTRFEIKKDLPTSLFGHDNTLASTDGLAVEHDPDNARMAEDVERGSLSGGFALLGADLFDVRGEPVRHLRYTDGLIPVSLFVTRVPVDSSGMRAPRASSTPLYMGLSSPMHVNQWKEGSEHYTLMGEVAPELLRRMSAPPTTAAK